MIDIFYEKKIRLTLSLEENLDNLGSSNKHFEMYLPIFDFFPSGYYAFSMTNTQDYANNYMNVYFVNDTSDFKDDPPAGYMKTVRDSIYIKTPYPDYIAPEIDPNQITIEALLLTLWILIN